MERGKVCDKAVCNNVISVDVGFETLSSYSLWITQRREREKEWNSIFGLWYSNLPLIHWWVFLLSTSTFNLIEQSPTFGSAGERVEKAMLTLCSVNWKRKVGVNGKMWVNLETKYTKKLLDCSHVSHSVILFPMYLQCFKHGQKLEYIRDAELMLFLKRCYLSL